MTNDNSQLSIKRQFGLVFSIGLAVIVLLQIWILGIQLPPEVPIHFDFNGEPDGFSSRSTHLWTMSSLVVGTTLFFLFFCWLTPKIPDSMVNLPDKEYWLAEERRSETYVRIQLMLIWVGVLTTLLFSTLAFFSWLVGMNYLASISPWIWLVTLIYMVAIVSICLGQFRKPQSKVEQKT